MKFETDSSDDRKMRQRVLTELLIVDRGIRSRHLRTFTVERTVTRKGYRTTMPTFDDDAMARYDEPYMTLVTIAIEVPEDVNTGFRALVDDVKEIEALGVRKAKEARLEVVRQALAAAQAEIDTLEEELKT